MNVNLSTLRFGARVLSDTVNDAHVSEDEIDLWLHQGMREWDSFLRQSYGEMYNAANTTFTSLNGQALFSLSVLTGGKFSRLLGVERQVDGEYVPLKSYTWAKRHENDGVQRYALVGDNIRLQPPARGETYQLWYRYPPFSLTVSSQNWDFQVERGDEYVQACAAEKALIKQDRDRSGVLRLKSEIRAEITQSAANRDIGEPLKVQEVRDDSDHGLDWFR